MCKATTVFFRYKIKLLFNLIVVYFWNNAYVIINYKHFFFMENANKYLVGLKVYKRSSSLCSTGFMPSVVDRITSCSGSHCRDKRVRRSGRWELRIGQRGVARAGQRGGAHPGPRGVALLGRRGVAPVGPRAVAHELRRGVALERGGWKVRSS